MQTALSRFFDLNKYGVFLLLIAANLGVIYITQHHLQTAELIYNTFSDRTTMEEVVAGMARKNQGSWMAYIFAPLLLIVKVVVIAFVINLLLLVLQIKLSFRKLLGIVLVAELVFTIAGIFRVFWLLYFADVQTLEDLNTAPLSLLSAVNQENLAPYLRYPLSQLNLFQVLYWCFLSLGLGYVLNEKFGKSLKLVAGSYGLALFTWLAFVSMGTGIYESTLGKHQFAERWKTPPTEVIDQIIKEQPDKATAFKDTPMILYFFSAECGECEAETQAIIDNMESLQKARILMITRSDSTAFKTFNEQFELEKYPNINVVTDGAGKISASYGIEQVPTIFLYDEQHKLVRQVAGKLKPEAIVKALKL